MTFVRDLTVILKTAVGLSG